VVYIIEDRVDLLKKFIRLSRGADLIKEMHCI
jgi:hypothetical protein